MVNHQGGIVLPQEVKVGVNYQPGQLSAPVGVLLPGPQIMVIGGMTKVEELTCNIAAAAVDWDWENDPEGCGDRALKRALAVGGAIQRAIDRAAEAQKNGKEEPATNGQV